MTAHLPIGSHLQKEDSNELRQCKGSSGAIHIREMWLRLGQSQAWPYQG